jgi:hypothetical protein
MTNKSVFINRDIAAQAVRTALPMIAEAVDKKDPAVGDSGFFHLVVMDPSRPPGSCHFEEAILYEYSVGDREKWDADYAAFARAKAKVAWQAGMDSCAAQALRLWGSAVVDGIVVGASGLQAWYDEAFAGAVAMCLRALAKGQAEAARKEGRLFL